MNTGRTAALKAVEYYLPEQRLTNADLAADFPDWPLAKIEQKTGISERRIASPEQCASDLAIAAARKLFHSGACKPGDIDFILNCTQTPDYFLPTTACLIQERLGVPVSTGALDFNLGSSGYVYGLALAQGLIESGHASNVLLLTSDTYSKLIHPADKSARTVFGDGAAATLICGVDQAEPLIGPFVFGTDGRGAPNLIVPAGGMRIRPSCQTAAMTTDASGNVRSQEHLFMDGGEIFAFALSGTRKMVSDLLARAGKTLEDINLVVPHQPNEFMLQAIRKQLKIPEDRFYIYLRECGNTVSATIPIALKAAQTEGRLKNGDLVMLVGFGVGYSWAATLVRWIG